MKPKLSGRDREILELMAKGKRDKQMAAYLEVSEPTLRQAIHRILTNLGARTRCEAVVKSRENNDDGET